MSFSPNSLLERELWDAGFTVVAGVDETGRGSLAGPVFAAAVVLDMGNLPDGLNDSKKLSAGKREELEMVLRESAIVSVASASRDEIDGFNILNASLLAMRRAVNGLQRQPDHLLVDGNRLPCGLNCPARAVVAGDTLSLSIAAASIVAKVERDRHMSELGRLHPGYGWSRNCGYGTRQHIEALKRLGPTQHHRQSFKPVRDAMELRLFVDEQGDG